MSTKTATVITKPAKETKYLDNPKSGDLSGDLKSGDLSGSLKDDKTKPSSGSGVKPPKYTSEDTSLDNPKSGDLSGDLGNPSQGNNNSLFGTPGNDNLVVTNNPCAPDFIIQGNGGNDTLVGGNGKDILNGTNDTLMGVGERDVLTGGNGKDLFVLGNQKGAFYLGNGNCDYAEIKDFDPNQDTIRLAGSAQDYSITYSNGIASISYIGNGGCPDLVAKVNSPCGPLSLTGSYFNYGNQCWDGNSGGGNDSGGPY
jgi:Ca2+-binding RTX toxin-like protein